MEKSLSYAEVFLKPKFSPYKSRSDVDTSVKLGNHTFKLPIVPANMKCVIDHKRAEWMSANGYFYIMHRFGKKDTESIMDDNKQFVAKANENWWQTISISLGVNITDKYFLSWIIQNNYRVDFITFDIAHGHSVLMKEMLEYVKGLTFKASWGRHNDNTCFHRNDVPETYIPTIIAGNVATDDAVHDLAMWGADIVKVGIAQGGACTTFGKTGFGGPMFSKVRTCSYVSKMGEWPKWIPIIADGGIRTNGDIAKALAAGAVMVMAGGLFAATKDSPAEDIHQKLPTEFEMDGRNYIGCVDGPVTHKIYYGSASEDNTHSTHHIEGTKIKMPVDRWTYAEKLIELQEDLQSAISYAGGDLTKAEWGIRTA
jgi:GMP reductase